MNALTILSLYLGPFIAIGVIARLVARGWMTRRNLDLGGVRGQIGPSAGKRSVFLLGFWRNEDPDR